MEYVDEIYDKCSWQSRNSEEWFKYKWVGHESRLK